MINLKQGRVTPGKWEQGLSEHLRQEKTIAVFESVIFKKCCEEAGVKPTKRQAVKFKNKRGVAYSFH